MSDVCPGCGASVKAELNRERVFNCFTREFDQDGRWPYLLRSTEDCLTRQLAQAKTRIAELRAQHDTLYRAVCEVGFALGLVMPESAYLFAAQGTERVKALQSDLAAMGAVVRAAVEQSSLADEGDADPADFTVRAELMCAQADTEAAVRALPPKLREKWGGHE